MTKNRQRKDAARDRAGRDGVPYTQALREQSLDEPGRESAPDPFADMFADRVLVNAVPWADVLLDGRRQVEFSSSPLPAVLPPAGDRTPGSGTREVALSDGPVMISAHTLPWTSPSRDPFTAGTGGRGCVVTRLAYTDGWSVASVSRAIGGNNQGPHRVWGQYTADCQDGFVRALSPGDMHPEVLEAWHERAARAGALRVRDAVQDLDRWYGQEQPPFGIRNEENVADLFLAASLGFASSEAAWQVMAGWRLSMGWLEVLNGQDTGLSLDDPEDVTWLAAAGEGYWPWRLPGGWAEIVAARRSEDPEALEDLYRRVGEIEDEEIARGDVFPDLDGDDPEGW